MNEELRENNEGFRKYFNPANKKTLIILLIVVLSYTYLLNVSSEKSIEGLTITQEAVIAHEQAYNSRLKWGLIAAGAVLLVILLSGRNTEDEYITLREAILIANAEVNDLHDNPRKYGVRFPDGELRLEIESSRHPNTKDFMIPYEYELGMSIEDSSGLKFFYSMKVDALRSRSCVTHIIFKGRSDGKRYKGDELYYVKDYVPVSTAKDYVALDRSGSI